MFWYLKNWCRKLHINLKEPHEDAVLRNTNVATPRTVETKCYQYMEPNAIHNYYKYLTLVLFSAPFKHFKWIPFSQVHSRSSNCPYTYVNNNKVRELITVKVLHISLLNTTMVAFKVRPLGSYAPMPAPSPSFQTILELVLWNDLQSCRCITPDVINVIKIASFQYFLYLREQKRVNGG